MKTERIAKIRILLFMAIFGDLNSKYNQCIRLAFFSIATNFLSGHRPAGSVQNENHKESSNEQIKKIELLPAYMPAAVRFYKVTDLRVYPAP